jgi:hypothetical protein
MTPKPLTEFHLLKKLPIEMEVKIYETAIEDIKSRAIHIQPNSAGNFVPALLHSCVFIRNLALRKYTRFTVSARKYGKKFALLVNFEKDSIVLADNKVPPVMPGSMFGITGFSGITGKFSKLFSQVQNLTIHQKALQMSFDGHYDAIWTSLFLGPPKLTLGVILETCPKLKRLTIVLDAKNGNATAEPFSVNSIDPFRYVFYCLCPPQTMLTSILLDMWPASNRSSN